MAVNRKKTPLEPRAYIGRISCYRASSQHALQLGHLRPCAPAFSAIFLFSWPAGLTFSDILILYVSQLVRVQQLGPWRRPFRSPRVRKHVSLSFSNPPKNIDRRRAPLLVFRLPCRAFVLEHL